MMKKYTNPDLEIIRLDLIDIVTGSGQCGSADCEWDAGDIGTGDNPEEGGVKT